MKIYSQSQLSSYATTFMNYECVWRLYLQCDAMVYYVPNSLLHEVKLLQSQFSSPNVTSFMNSECVCDVFTYSVTQFLGRSVGMWRRLRREQSTTAPEAEHEHGAGQTSDPNVAEMSDKMTTKSRIFNIFKFSINSFFSKQFFSFFSFAHFSHCCNDRHTPQKRCYYYFLDLLLLLSQFDE